MNSITRKLSAIALCAAATLTTPAAPVEARANGCSVTYGISFAFAECVLGNYGDPFWIVIPCKKDAWWSNHRVNASGDLGRVGYSGRYSSSDAYCPSGYRRTGGGTIHTP